MRRGKLSSLAGDEREQTLAYVKQRWSQYYGASRDIRKDASNFIAIMNGGGAATVLAFSGAVFSEHPELANALPLKLSIFFFVFGVASSALAYVAEWLRLDGLFAKWRAATDQFYTDRIGFDDMYDEDIRRAAEIETISTLLISVSFACLAIGMGLGALLLTGD